MRRGLIFSQRPSLENSLFAIIGLDIDTEDKKMNLKFQSVFDIIGPIMIGPSSSHTAGAVRIGKIVSSIFGDQPTEVEFQLFNSLK